MDEKPIKNWFHRPVAYVVGGIVAAGLSVVIFAAAQYFIGKRSDRLLDNPASADTKLQLADGGVSQLKQTSESFRNVAKLVGPAVVNIKSTKGSKGKGWRSSRKGRKTPQDEEEPFRDPFFDFFERFGHPFLIPDAPQTSLGSGLMVDRRGFVVTNNHVVEDASEILVSLAGDKVENMKAKVVGTDPKTDLAVLRIENSKDLPVADWADSDQVEVGDWAIAIGSPFDLRQTVTVGIVSAKGRSPNVLAGAEYVGELIQTDAAINPGNSGGPLCTLEGKVMGVNTAIYTRSGGYMGIGFAIPSNLAKDVVGKLITEGKIVRGWLGVYIQQLNADLAKELNVKEGVSIHEVMEGSPAAGAGLKAGDIVIEVDGNPAKDVAQLQRTISNYKPGQNIKLKVVSYADKRTRTVSVKIGEVPDSDGPARVTREDDSPDKLGLIVGEVRGKEGVVVQAIQPGSVAEQIGLEPGDVILRINRNTLNSIMSYRKAVESTKRLNLEVRRRERTLFFSFVLPPE